MKAAGAAGLAAGIPLVFPPRTQGGLQQPSPTGEPVRDAIPACDGRGNCDTLRSLAAKRSLLIGTAFSPGICATDATYRAVVAREFNCLVSENDMKLDVIQRVRGEFDFGNAEAMLAFAAQHDMKVRAVPLVWHDALPQWAVDTTFSRQEALAILREHIFTVMHHFRGRVFAWDVLNEGLNDAGPGLRQDSVWYRSIGADYVEQVYRWAHEADPQAQLFYNDYNMDGVSEPADRCYQWIKELLARGVPIHGIGLQYHVKVEKHPSPAAVAQNIRRFNDLGLIVHITELDVWLPPKATEVDFQKQAEIYRGVFETALAAQNCPAVLLWGFTDRYSWVPGTTGGTYDHALIFDRTYRPKPAYDAIARALR